MAYVVYDGISATFEVYCQEDGCNDRRVGEFDCAADAADYTDEHEDDHYYDD